jgi:hypothetical protein
MAKSTSRRLVVCINNDGYPAALEKRKIYILLRDPAAEKRGLLRIIDESGDDYLYPKLYFRSLALPQSVTPPFLSAKQVPGAVRSLVAVQAACLRPIWLCLNQQGDQDPSETR